MPSVKAAKRCRTSQSWFLQLWLLRTLYRYKDYACKLRPVGTLHQCTSHTFDPDWSSRCTGAQITCVLPMHATRLIL